MKFKHGTTTYEVPSNWSMVKFKDFASFHDVDLPLGKKLSYQTTIPEDVLSNLRSADLIRLLEVIGFMEGLPEFWDTVDLKMNVGDEHYIKMEKARKAFECGNKWKAAIEITKIYTGKDISELTVLQAFGYAVFFLNSFRDSLKSTNDLENTSTTKTS